MNQAQRKHLRERIEKADCEHKRKLYKDGPMTPEVKKAQAIMKKWHEDDETREQAARAAIRAALIAAQEVLFFEDPEAALKAVKAFEAMKFSK
jgi:hypothetical protein